MGIRLGIGGLKIGQRSGTAAVPFDWSSYWATLISAVVNEADATHIDLTFAEANESVIAGDFTIPDVTINSGSWTGAVFTLVLSAPLYVSKTITFTRSGGTSLVKAPRFVITVDTTKAGSANDTFVLPVTAKSAASYFVDWGDGGAEEEFTTTGNKDHTYAESGTYQVKVRGGMTALEFAGGGDMLKLMSIDNWGILAWSSMHWAFYGCANMEGKYEDYPNTTAATNTALMFHSCAKFNSAVNFSTAEVTDMGYMFYGCTLFNQSVSSFNTAKATAMHYMFYACPAFNQSVSNFDTAKVTNMSYMFRGCTVFNQSVSNFNTALVTNMDSMFRACVAFNQSVSSFDTGKVTNMANMFTDCYVFNQSVASFNVALVTNMTGMFSGANALSAANYDALLISWSAQSVQDSVTFHAGDATYSEGDAADARTHLVTATGSGGHGWTITDEGLSFDNGKLIITTDDVRASIYSLMYPILLDKGIKATHYFTLNYIDAAGYMTWAQIEEFNTAGMDIQCHGQTHTSFTLLNEAQLTAELQAVEAAFATHSIAAPNHTAYPSGEYNDNVKTWTAAERQTGRTVVAGYVIRKDDKYTLKCSVCDTKTFAQIAALIDYAMSQKKALVILIHRLDEVGYMSSTVFEQVVDYAQTAGIDIITMTQLYALLD